MRILIYIVFAFVAYLEMDAVSAYELPDIGAHSSSVLERQQERQIGEQVVRSFRQADYIIDDPELNAYLHALGLRLTVHSESDGQSFNFFLVKSTTINAFALPGGFIGVHAGLMFASQNESELAGVLAHEIAHITQRHYARAYENTSKLGLATAAAVLAGIVVSGQDAEAGSALMIGGIAGASQGQINFTRSNEQEADRVGVELLARAGLDPMGMPSFFERLHIASRYQNDQVPEFLLTHPVSLSRLADTRHRVEQMSQSLGKMHDDQLFQLMRARLDALSYKDQPREGVNYFKQLRQSNKGDKLALDYGYALSLSANGNHKQALSLIQKLLQTHPEQMNFLLAEARIIAAQGDHEQAAKRYRQLLKLYPANASLTLYYAQLLLNDGQAIKARRLLEEYLQQQSHPYPIYYQLLAQAHKASGDSASSHQAMAEYYYLTGLTNPAIRQLQLAQQIEGLDYYQLSAIEARIKTLTELAQLESKLKK